MAPSLSQSVEVAPELTVEVKQEIALALSVYQDLKLTADLLWDQMEEEKVAIFKRLQDAGVDKTIIDQVNLTIVRANQNSLNKEQFVKLGGSLKILDAATEKKPKKPYLRIGE